MRISLVIKYNIIIRKFELRLSKEVQKLFPSKSYKSAVFFSKIRKKVMTPFKCLKIVKNFAARYSSHSLLVITKHPSESEYSNKNPPNNRFEDIEMTAGGSYCMWNFLEQIRKEVEFAMAINKKTTQFRVPFFGLGVFKWCYALLWNHTCNELQFSQNFQDKPRNLKRHFFNNPVFFFCGTDH